MKAVEPSLEPRACMSRGDVEGNREAATACVVVKSKL